MDRQKYQIINDGFNSVISSLKTLGEKFGTKIEIKKEVSKTNLWKMVIDHFSNISDVISQLTFPTVIETRVEKYVKQTDEELLELIKPLIPKIKVEVPTTEDILELIKPLIPKAKNGKTPSDARLLTLISQLIPKIPTAEELISEVTERIIVPSLPSAEELAEELGNVKKEWVPIEAIRGDFNTRVHRSFGSGGKIELQLQDEGGEIMYVDRINFAGNGVTVTKMGNKVVTVTIPGGGSLWEPYTQKPHLGLLMV